VCPGSDLDQICFDRRVVGLSNTLTSKCQHCGTSASMEVFFASDIPYMTRADEKFRKAHEGCAFSAKKAQNTPSKIQICTRPAPHSGPCNGLPCDYVLANWHKLSGGKSTPGHSILTPRRKSVLPRLWKWIRRLWRDR
jgi:hypothetical protein